MTAQDLLKDGLGPFVEREFRSVYGDRAAAEAGRFAGDDRRDCLYTVATIGAVVSGARRSRRLDVLG